MEWVTVTKKSQKDATVVKDVKKDKPLVVKADKAKEAKALSVLLMTQTTKLLRMFENAQKTRLTRTQRRRESRKRKMRMEKDNLSVISYATCVDVDVDEDVADVHEEEEVVKEDKLNTSRASSVGGDVIVPSRLPAPMVDLLSWTGE